MRFFVMLCLLISGPAIADTIVSESDTGIVFGDVDCLNIDYEAGEVTFDKDWDYLFGSVQITMECVTRSGRITTLTGGDTVLFPELTFDWMDQAWYHGDTLIASYAGWRDITVNPDLDIQLWTDMGDEYVAFKIQFVEVED